jgi:exopolysaccharide biosynthesis polyprenyl glycosylphosphotransferase
VIWIATLILMRTLRRASLRLLVGAGGVPPIRFALVGCNESGIRLARALPHAGVLPHAWSGVFRVPGDDPVPEGIADLGPVDRLAERAEMIGCDRILVALPASQGEILELVATACREKDIDLDVVPGLAFPFRRGINVEEVAGLPVVSGRRLPLAGWNNVAKRTLDIVVSSALLVLAFPLLLGCAIAVKLDSPGPVFYRQTRIGRDRRAFEIVKFRSMRMDAEAASGPVWAKENDPRRTRLGTFLRTWSLDELPQLWNVLVGEMSLVGPRPERPQFVGEFLDAVPDYWGRHRIKSGLTGWAQVNGLRGNSLIDERTKYDLYYMENWSLWFDLRILFMTVKAVFTHRGS